MGKPVQTLKDKFTGATQTIESGADFLSRWSNTPGHSILTDGTGASTTYIVSDGSKMVAYASTLDRNGDQVLVTDRENFGKRFGGEVLANVDDIARTISKNPEKAGQVNDFYQEMGKGNPPGMTPNYMAVTPAPGGMK